MVMCSKCDRENDDRNYYCYWCEERIKEPGHVRGLKHKYDYLLTLKVVEDDSNDRDYFGSYTARKKDV